MLIHKHGIQVARKDLALAGEGCCALQKDRPPQVTAADELMCWGMLALALAGLVALIPATMGCVADELT